MCTSGHFSRGGAIDPSWATFCPQTRSLGQQGLTPGPGVRNNGERGLYGLLWGPTGLGLGASGTVGSTQTLRHRGDPGWGAQWVRVLSQCTKVAGSMPGQSTNKKQPVNA